MDFWPKVIFDYQRQVKITLRKCLILQVFERGGVERGVRSGYNKRRLADIQENIGKQKVKIKCRSVVWSYCNCFAACSSNVAVAFGFFCSFNWARSNAEPSGLMKHLHATSH